MITIDIEAIKLSEVLDRITFYSDNAFKIALEDIISEKIKKSIEEQTDCFDIIVKIRIGERISFADIKKIGGLPLHDIEIVFKSKILNNLLELNFPQEYKNGFYDSKNKKVVKNDYIHSNDIRIIIQKRAYKYIKSMRFIIIPSKKFIIHDDILKNCLCEFSKLYPVSADIFYVREYIIWQCCVCGKEYICSCFKKALNNMPKGGGYFADMLGKDLKNTTFKNKICHLCRKISSSQIFYSYGGKIGAYYMPYIMREQYEKNIEYRDAENNIREELGIPKIGESWISQTQLYYTIKTLFPNYEIQREASPEWLGRQRYDIYFPNEKLAIEYQGKQHYEPVILFGGEQGYKNTIERDKEKLKKSKENGVNIIYISYKDKLDENTLYKRIKKYLENK